ncbi:MAG: C4-type zinc ribbon domain-containing protein [Peptococcaceae bacterium]|jgi:predicted  nucleic acid-binding Zn-ribbon protein|nr:C4-type zinc ribbon domain-containing protein [Peptococcaceae bacterium]
MPDMKLLWEIQVLDMHRRLLEERLKDQSVPEELKNLKNSIDLAQEELQETREEYGRLKKDIRAFDVEDVKMREEIASIERELFSRYGTDSPEGVATAERVQLLKEKLKRLEGRQVSLLEVMERIHRRIDEQGRCLSRHKEKYRRLQTTYQMNVENIRKTLSQIPLNRQRLIDAVDAGLWKRYVQLKTRFKDPVGKVEKGICNGCHAPVPFSELKRLKLQDGVVNCPACGRLLYWERAAAKYRRGCHARRPVV